MKQAFIAIIVAIAGFAVTAPQAHATCKGCENVSPPPVVDPPASTWDYKTCTTKCYDKDIPGGVQLPWSMNFPGIPGTSAMGVNCDGEGDANVSVAFSAGVAEAVEVAIEGSIIVAGGTVTTSITFSQEIGYQCSKDIPPCRWASAKMNFSANAVTTGSAVERFTYQTCTYYETKTFCWMDWCWPDSRVTTKSGPAASCGLQNGKYTANISVGVNCKFNGGTVTQEQCPSCFEDKCTLETPACADLEEGSTELCCEEGVEVVPVDEESDTDTLETEEELATGTITDTESESTSEEEKDEEQPKEGKVEPYGVAL